MDKTGFARNSATSSVQECVVIGRVRERKREKKPPSMTVVIGLTRQRITVKGTRIGFKHRQTLSDIRSK